MAGGFVDVTHAEGDQLFDGRAAGSGYFDNSGWTVATGGASARGGDRTQVQPVPSSAIDATFGQGASSFLGEPSSSSSYGVQTAGGSTVMYLILGSVALGLVLRKRKG